MVLLINGKIIDFHPDELRALLRDQPCSQEAIKFHKKPLQIVETNNNLLFVHQREMAVISQQDPAVCYLGTDDATTCHFVVLDCINAGLIGAAHLDGGGTETFFDIYTSQVRKAVDKYNYLKRIASSKSGNSEQPKFVEPKLSNQFDVSVFVVGGFTDDAGYSEKLSKEILSIMSDNYSDINFQLELFCVTDLNNRIKSGFNFPIAYGCLYNSRIHRMLPASFSRNAREPQHILRSTRFCCPATVYNVYNTDDCVLQLNDFNYKGYDNRGYYLQLSQAPDSKLRKFSTSPRQEKDGYEAALRSVFKFMADYPDPKSSVFKSESGLRYKCDPRTGEWIDYNK